MEGKRVLIVARLKILDVTQNSICFFLPLIAGNPYGVGNWTNRWIWSSYSDLTRPHPKWWYSKGNPLISGKSGLVKYLLIWPDECPEDNGTWGKYFSFERCFSAAFTHPTRQWDSQVHSELDHFAFLSRGSTLILRRNVRWRIERHQLWLISWMSTKCNPKKIQALFSGGVGALGFPWTCFVACVYVITSSFAQESHLKRFINLYAQGAS